MASIRFEHLWASPNTVLGLLLAEKIELRLRFGDEPEYLVLTTRRNVAETTAYAQQVNFFPGPTKLIHQFDDVMLGFSL